MDAAWVARGRLIDGKFVPDAPLPQLEGRAELIVYPQAQEANRGSVFDLLGKASQLRSAEEIDQQIQEEREAWDRP